MMIERNVSVLIETNPTVNGGSFTDASRWIELSLSSLGSPIASLDARHERGHAVGSTLASVYSRTTRPLTTPVLADYRTSHALDEGLQFLRDVRLGNRVLSALLAAIDGLPERPLRIGAIATARSIEGKTARYSAHLLALLQGDLDLARSMIQDASLARGTRVRPERPDTVAIWNSAGDRLEIRDFSLKFNNTLADWSTESELSQTVSGYLVDVVIPELARLLASAQAADEESKRLARLLARRVP